MGRVGVGDRQGAVGSRAGIRLAPAGGRIQRAPAQCSITLAGYVRNRRVAISSLASGREADDMARMPALGRACGSRLFDPPADFGFDSVDVYGILLHLVPCEGSVTRIGRMLTRSVVRREEWMEGAQHPGVSAAARKLEIAKIRVDSLLDEAVARFPNHTAIDFLGRRWSYNDLSVLVDRAARGFQDL
eukprot:gene27430-30321_t